MLIVEGELRLRVLLLHGGYAWRYTTAKIFLAANCDISDTFTIWLLLKHLSTGVLPILATGLAH